MFWKVKVYFSSDEDDYDGRHPLGWWSGEAASKKAAENEGYKALWDDRLDGASCMPIIIARRISSTEAKRLEHEGDE